MATDSRKAAERADTRVLVGCENCNAGTEVVHRRRKSIDCWLCHKPIELPDYVEEFVKQERLATIERCAQIADEYLEFIQTLPENMEPIAVFAKDLTKRVAAAIRALKGK